MIFHVAQNAQSRFVHAAVQINYLLYLYIVFHDHTKLAILVLETMNWAVNPMLSSLSYCGMC